MASLEDLYANIPTAQIAQQLGIDESTAQDAIHSVVPQLLGGLHEHTQDPEKEATLAAALEEPGTEPTEGHALVSSLFGSENNQVAAALSTGNGVDSGLVQKLLPILLPIVISYISQKAGGKSGAAQPSAAGGGGILGDLIGGIIGGASGGQGGGALGSVLGSVLSNSLGGGSAPAPEQPAKSEDSGGLFGKILGGLLNRKK